MSEENDLNFIEHLRAHGLQVTYQRLAIYEVLHRSAEHLSAEEIHDKIKTRFPMISLGTVYKSLEKFCEAGLVRKISLTDVSRYESKTDSHHHLFCEKCGAIHDVAHHIGENKIQLPEDHGFEIIRQEIILRGYCPKCKGDGVCS